jgi:hypothetical protein
MAARFELWPNNAHQPPLKTYSNGKRYCTIILRCRDDAQLHDSANEQDPPPQDNGVERVFAAPPAKKHATARNLKKND